MNAFLLLASICAPATPEPIIEPRVAALLATGERPVLPMVVESRCGVDGAMPVAADAMANLKQLK